VASGVDAASFDFYEGVRIFVPGAITLGLVAGVESTFGIRSFYFTEHEVTSVVGALVAGLMFYFTDMPARAAVYKPFQPTSELKSWGKPKGGVGLANLYFVMLDTDVPGPIRARALYMGSMYRIGFEAIYLLLGTSVGVLLGATMTTSRAGLRQQRPPFADTGVVIAIAIGMILLAMRNERARRKRNKQSETDSHAGSFPKIDEGAIVILTAATVAIQVKASDLSAIFRAIPSMIALLLWVGGISAVTGTSLLMCEFLWTPSGLRCCRASP
jgi:hypothetical protein